MRKIISVSFIVILFVNLFGYFISFTVQRYKIKSEAQEEKQKHTQQFVFSDREYEQLNTYEGGSEFSLNGGMYDIVNKELKGERIILTAYYDHRETGLLSEFVSYFKEETQPVNNKQIIPVFSLLEFVFSPNEWKCFDLFTCLLISPLYNSKLLTFSFDITSPPPDLT